MTIEDLRTITRELSKTLIALENQDLPLTTDARTLLTSAIQEAEVLEVMAGNNRYILPEGEAIVQRVGILTSKDLHDLGYAIDDDALINRIASRVGWGYDAILETRQLALQVYLARYYPLYQRTP